jgi:hypothetical protein
MGGFHNFHVLEDEEERRKKKEERRKKKEERRRIKERQWQYTALPPLYLKIM